jgi:hypothetical protein
MDPDNVTKSPHQIAKVPDMHKWIKTIYPKARIR